MRQPLASSCSLMERGIENGFRESALLQGATLVVPQCGKMDLGFSP